MFFGGEDLGYLHTSWLRNTIALLLERLLQFGFGTRKPYCSHIVGQVQLLSYFLIAVAFDLQVYDNPGGLIKLAYDIHQVFVVVAVKYVWIAFELVVLKADHAALGVKVVISYCWGQLLRKIQLIPCLLLDSSLDLAVKESLVVAASVIDVGLILYVKKFKCA